MHYVIDLFTNIFIIVALSSWFEAQVLKFIIHSVVNRKIDFSRLVGDGGMPSGHSATVASLAASIGIVNGFGSSLFAIAAIFAIIVCHDAAGVRLETGKQSTVLNEMRNALNILTSNKLPDVKLKEFVGHTHSQVVVGVILGIINAIFICVCFT